MKSAERFLVAVCLLVNSCAGKEVRYSSSQQQYQHYPQQYRPYDRPRSRAYSNPYAYPPYNYYPYYDVDSYYVPPRNLGNDNAPDVFNDKY
ncbi:MAG: hypothetical protein FJX34_03310 [Alphaproteobacteria bacterium]|nr:hypothetical protein [Alphaproteobacteria bacterium]